MANGLSIDLEKFKKLNAKDRDELIYQNLLHIRSKIGDTKFHTKLQYAWLVVLTTATGLRKYLPI